MSSQVRVCVTDFIGHQPITDDRTSVSQSQRRVERYSRDAARWALTPRAKIQRDGRQHNTCFPVILLYQTGRFPKTYYNSRLTDIHAILQADLQVLCRLLLRDPLIPRLPATHVNYCNLELNLINLLLKINLFKQPDSTPTEKHWTTRIENK